MPEGMPLGTLAVSICIAIVHYVTCAWVTTLGQRVRLLEIRAINPRSAREAVCRHQIVKHPLNLIHEYRVLARYET